MATHELTTADSGLIKVAGTTLSGVMAGVHSVAKQTLTGAVGVLDFGGSTVKRFSLTGNITGAFTFPPQNVPTVATDNYRLVLAVEFEQDGSGGRTMNLATLFAGADSLEGTSAPDLSPNGVTRVLLVADRASGAVTYTANLSPTIDGAQITSGTIPVTRIQDASTTQKGVIQIGTGPGGAAAGNHVHSIPDARPFVIRRSDGGTLVTGIEDILSDVPFGGTILRLTKTRLLGDTAATATVAIRIDTSNVTGAAGNITGAALSGDMTATGANSFNDRQAIRINVTAITGTPKTLIGMLHFTRNGLPAE